MNDDTIYRAYPRHIAPIAAKKAIAKAVQREAKALGEAEARKMIYDAVVRFAASPAGNKGCFTPHPSTWFNQGRYGDNPAEWWSSSSPMEPGVNPYRDRSGMDRREYLNQFPDHWLNDEERAEKTMLSGRIN